MRMGVLHIGQPLFMDATVSSQVAQRHMTNAPFRVSVDHITLLDHMSFLFDYAVVHVAQQLLLTIQLRRFAAFLGVPASSGPAFSAPPPF